MAQVVGIFVIIVIAVISVISVIDMLIDGLNQAYKDDNNRKFVRGWVAVFGFAIIMATLICLAVQRNNAQEVITELTKQVEAIETAETTDTQNYDYIILSYSHTIYTNEEGKQFVIFYHYGYYYEYPDNGKIDAWNDYILQMNDNDTPDNFIDDYIVGVYQMYEYNGVTPPSTHYNDGYGNNFNEYRVEYVSALG